jgi:hypothetical protein
VAEGVQHGGRCGGSGGDGARCGASASMMLSKSSSAGPGEVGGRERGWVPGETAVMRAIL